MTRGREEVESAIESTGPSDAEAVFRETGTGDDDRIVVIRPQVIDNIGHVLGNMFQK